MPSVLPEYLDFASYGHRAFTDCPCMTSSDFYCRRAVFVEGKIPIWEDTVDGRRCVPTSVKETIWMI